MKIKSLMYVLMGTFTIVACTNSDNEEVVNNGGGGDNSPEYVIPAGFDFATSRSVTVAVASSKPVVVSLYPDEDCKEESYLVSDLLVKGEKSLELNVPIHSTKLYLKYSTETETGKVVGFPITSATRAGEAVAITVPEDAVQPTHEEDAGFLFYHNTGVAMFEDNWPIEPGKDNDLNDVVFEYDLKVTECQKEELLANHGYKEGLKMTLDIRAKGGVYPTRIGVVLGGLDKKYIDEDAVVTRIVLKKGQGMEEELANGVMKAEMSGTLFGKSQFCKVTVDTQNGNPVIVMDGLSALGDNVNFFQTTEGHINPGQGMLRAEITLRGKLRTTLSEEQDQLKAYRELVTNTNNQNFFIVTNTNKEIHMKGYKPSYLYTNYEADSAGEMMDGVPYCNKNGFVWGIKVPAGVKHAYEKVLFDDAYPEFRGWVTSNGVDNKDWYLHPVGGKVVEAW
jgi:LruC domain-containing protein